jgi:hypothetical protein
MRIRQPSKPDASSLLLLPVAALAAIAAVFPDVFNGSPDLFPTLHGYAQPTLDVLQRARVHALDTVNAALAPSLALNVPNLVAFVAWWFFAVSACRKLAEKNGVDGWTLADLMHGMAALFTFSLPSDTLTSTVRLDRMQFHMAYHLVFTVWYARRARREDVWSLAFTVYSIGVVSATLLHLSVVAVAALDGGSASGGWGSSNNGNQEILAFMVRQTTENLSCLTGPAVWMIYCLTRELPLCIFAAYKGWLTLSCTAEYFRDMERAFAELPRSGGILGAGHGKWIQPSLMIVGVNMWIVVWVFVMPRIAEFLRRALNIAFGIHANRRARVGRLHE